MKASNVTAPKKAAKEKPDLEEAVDEEDEVEEAVEVDNDDNDLENDKYIKKPKAKKNTKKVTGNDDDGGSKPAKRKARGRPKKK